MRNAYYEELDSLYGRYIDLACMVQERINEAVTAFQSHDIDQAKAIIESDQYINEIEAELEKDCIQVIALQQPVTSDLRRLITIIKASTDLERIADHARGLAYATQRMSGPRDEEFEEAIKKMAQIIDEMMDLIIQASKDQDVLLAAQAARLDDQADQYNKEISKRASDILLSEGESSGVYLEYKSVAADLERIGDYITNIAELVVYLETGEVSELNPRYSKPEFSLSK